LPPRGSGVTLASFVPTGKLFACFVGIYFGYRFYSMEVCMSLELFNQIEQKVTDTVDALEMMKLENEELRGENAKLKEEREEWERRLNGLLSKFDSLETSSAS
jgi:cell division protein ZapB